MSGKAGARIKAKAEQGWWYRATDEERLAQIRGGIECGMTAPQVAMNVGARGYVVVAQFAARRGVHFPRGTGIGGVVRNMRVWGAKHRDAFDIFGNGKGQDNLFEPHPLD